MDIKNVGLFFVVIGAAFALNMMFRIPVWCGFRITGLGTLMFLVLQLYGLQKKLY